MKPIFIITSGFLEGKKGRLIKKLNSGRIVIELLENFMAFYKGDQIIVDPGEYKKEK